jgi:hypothetical protein
MTDFMCKVISMIIKSIVFIINKHYSSLNRVHYFACTICFVFQVTVQLVLLLADLHQTSLQQLIISFIGFFVSCQTTDGTNHLSSKNFNFKMKGALLFSKYGLVGPIGR